MCMVTQVLPHFQQASLSLSEWRPHRDILNPNQQVSGQPAGSFPKLCCVTGLFVDVLCCCTCPVLQINISSVCWHGVADASCVREVPESLWPPSWNNGQWGRWSQHFSIWQHRRWGLLHLFSQLVACNIVNFTIRMKCSQLLMGHIILNCVHACFEKLKDENWYLLTLKWPYHPVF